MLFQLYSDHAAMQLLGWVMVFCGLILTQVQKQNRLNPRAHLGLSLFFCMAQQHLFHSNHEKFDGVLQPM